MRGLLAAAQLDIAESLRARWFLLYALAFGGVIAALMSLGVADSRVMGFTSVSRTLSAYIQITMAALPIFVLVGSVRSIVGEREAGVFEYMLALPVQLPAWYFGRFLGRLAVVLAPVLGALGLAALWGALRGGGAPWTELGLYAGLIFALSVCFVGFAFLISAFARSLEVAQGAALALWLALVAFIDLILIGVLLRGRVAPGLIVGLSLANPLQVFRTAAMLVFDPQLRLLGPAAFLILDAFGERGYLAWAFAYPLALGSLAAELGYWRFRRGDLV